MGLGDLIEGTFKKVVDYVIELADDFADDLRRGILMLIHNFEKDIAKDWEKIFPEEIRDLPLFKQYESYVKENAGKKQAVAGIITSSLIGGAIGTGVGMGLGGFGRNIQNWFNTRLKPTPLTPAECAYAWNRGLYTMEQVSKHLLALGYDDNLHSILLHYYRPKLTLSELATCYHRKIINEEDFDYLVSELGYNEKERKWIKEIIWAYPSPTDFIRFAVRDVFVEDKEVKEALEAEFPEPIVPYAEKAGMSKDVLM